MSLLEEALKVPRAAHGATHSLETVVLAVAWVRGEVTSRQVRATVELKYDNNIYAWIATALKWGSENGDLVIYVNEGAK